MMNIKWNMIKIYNQSYIDNFNRPSSEVIMKPPAAPPSYEYTIDAIVHAT